MDHKKVKVNKEDRVKVIEKCEISPPPGSVPSTSIPLSFFDLPWLCCPPIKRSFIYDFPYPTHHLLQSVLPSLKLSLSITLQHFFPFCAKIVFPPKPHIPHILYSEGDSLSFTLAESTIDLPNLVSDSPRDVTDMHPFVPLLPPTQTLEDGTRLVSPMAIQVTVLPNVGFTVCITFRHAIADGRAFHHFMKSWASVCRSKEDLSSSSSSLLGAFTLPLHNRDMIIQDPSGLRHNFLQHLWNSSLESIESRGLVHDVPCDMVRHTFVLSHEHVEKLKKWVSIKCENHGMSVRSLHVSTFVVTCSLIWVCKVKSEETKVGTILANVDESHILAFMADCRNLAEFSIPSTYFGNCVVCGNVAVNKSKLEGEDGIFDAVIAIGSKVRELQCEALKGAETLMSNFTDFASLGKHMVIIAGSPKLDVYETDFGWGKPKMSEIVHVDNSSSISLSDCRDKQVGIVVGVALERIQMNKFNTILEELLRKIVGNL